MASPRSNNARPPANALVEITVELFGTARLACDRHDVTLTLPSRATLADVTRVLSEVCPELIGKAIAEDTTVLMKSYTLNLNGTAFLSGPAEQHLELREGDRLLLFSSQAGG